MKIKLNFKLGVLLIIFSGLLGACGNQDEAPVDGKIIINPTTLDLGDSAAALAVGGAGTCASVYPPNLWDVVPFRVTIFDGNGLPLGNTKFSVNIPWSQNTANWEPVAWIYDDLDGNNSVTDAAGNLQVATEEMTGMGDPTLFVTETNEKGYKDLFIVMDAKCVWTGQFDVQSGPLGEQVEIKKE